MTIEKQGSAFSPHKLHHPPGHGKQPGATNGVREDPGELATGDGVRTGTDQGAGNGFMIYGMQDQARRIVDVNPGEPLSSGTKGTAKAPAIQRQESSQHTTFASEYQALAQQ